jgi:hypothetical protein
MSAAAKKQPDIAQELLANLTAGMANPDKFDKAKEARLAKVKPSPYSRPIGEGTHTHHRDKALAHLEAAGAHAAAAHSASVVQAADGHDAALEAARAADSEVQKSSEGEGSRGGIVIGHTHGGEPIYQGEAHAYALHYRPFSPRDYPKGVIGTGKHPEAKDHGTAIYPEALDPTEAKDHGMVYIPHGDQLKGVAAKIAKPMEGYAAEYVAGHEKHPGDIRSKVNQVQVHADRDELARLVLEHLKEVAKDKVAKSVRLVVSPRGDK